MKFTVIGGGSTYTPELIDGFARLGDALAVTELTLVDPDAHRLEIVGAFARRIFAHYGHRGRISWTTSTDDGLRDADVVLIQLRVVGQAARIPDEPFPLKYERLGQK